jgi:anaerobic ribonucleoside-triphosphate reductase activating protein
LAKTNSYVKQMLDNIDVIIDGKYIEKLANDKLKYRGSSNQRIIDVAQSLKIKKIKLLLG